MTNQQAPELEVNTTKEIVTESFKGQDFNQISKQPDITYVFDELEWYESADKKWASLSSVQAREAWFNSERKRCESIWFENYRKKCDEINKLIVRINELEDIKRILLEELRKHGIQFSDLLFDAIQNKR